MTRESRDGGPAFPKFGMNAWDRPQTLDAGMSFRDTAALAALPAIIASTSAGQHMVDVREGETMNHAIARGAYHLADCLLLVRTEGQPALTPYRRLAPEQRSALPSAPSSSLPS